MIGRKKKLKTWVTTDGLATFYVALTPDDVRQAIDAAEKNTGWIDVPLSDGDRAQIRTRSIAGIQ